MGADVDSLPYTLVNTRPFERAYRRFARKHPELRSAVSKTFDALANNPFAPSLRLHALTGTLAGKQAVSVNYAYRIVLCVEVSDREIILHNIGTHDEVYG